MASDIPKVEEIYNANNTTKQLSLLPAFEKFATSRGYNEKSIAQAKEEISKRFAQFNAEGMNDKRFRAITGTISNMIESELSRAKNKLLEQSGAMVGIGPVSIPADTQSPNALPIAVQKPSDKINLGTILKAINVKKEILASL